MKITYDHYAFQTQEYGGVTRYFFELISRVAQDPEFETSLFQGFHINRYPFKTKTFENYLGMHRPNIYKLRHAFNPINQFLFSNFINKSKPSLIHFTHFVDTAPKFNGARIITVHDMTHELFPGNFSPKDQTTKQKRAAVDRATHIFAVSQSTKRDLIQFWNIPESKITVTHHSNSLLFPKSESNFIKSPYILFTGNRAGYKNFQFLMKAFALTKARKSLKLVCFGGGGFSGDEYALIRDLGLEHVVLHLSGDDQRLSALYSHASCLVYPSLYEGFGFPILEAFQYDCPVIANLNSSIPEVAGNGAVFFDTNSLESLAFQIDRVLGDRELRSSLIAIGKERLKLFDWETSVKIAKEVYSSLQ